MTVEEQLRSALAATAASVTPQPHPVARLRLRQRRRQRTLAAATAGLTTILVVLVASVPAIRSLHSRLAETGQAPASAGYPIDSPWVQRLIDSPTRGTLASDRAYLDRLRRVLVDGPERRLVDAALDRLALLFVGDIGNIRMAVVAWHNATHATQFTYVGPIGAPAAELSRMGTLGNERPRPFLITDAMTERADGPWRTSFRLGLAPTGCTIAASTDGAILADGTVRRSWVPTGSDVAVRDSTQREARWRVSCDGTTRYEGPAVDLAEFSPTGPPKFPIGNVDGARGSVNRVEASATASALAHLGPAAGVPLDEPRVVWGDTPPGGGQPVTVAVARSAGGGVAVLVAQSFVEKALIGRAGRHVSISPGDDPTVGQSRQGWGLLATGVAGTMDFVAVRLPERSGSRAVWSDRVLVVAPTSAVRARVLDRAGREVARTDLVGGVGAVTLKVPSTVTLQAYDAAGTVLGTTPLAESTDAPTLFGEPTIEAW